MCTHLNNRYAKDQICYVKRYHQLKQKLKERSPFEYLLVEDISPAEPCKKYEYIQKFKEVGLSEKAALLTHSHGFVWKVLESVDEDISESQQTIEKAKAEIPVFILKL